MVYAVLVRQLFTPLNFFVLKRIWKKILTEFNTFFTDKQTGSGNYNIQYPIIVSNTVSSFGYLTELIGIIQFVALMLYYLSSTSYYLDRYYFIRKDKPNELLEAVAATGETHNPNFILDCLYQDIKKKHMIGFMMPGLICCICIIEICIPNSFWTASLQFDYTNLGIYLVFAGRYAQIGTIAMFIFTLILPFILSILYSLVIFCKTQSSLTTRQLIVKAISNLKNLKFIKQFVIE